jgi:hypothetical protein
MAIAHGRMIHRINSDGLRRRAIAPSGRRAQEALYSLGGRRLSTPHKPNFALWISAAFAPRATARQARKTGDLSRRSLPRTALFDTPGSKAGTAVLRPHSSVAINHFIGGCRNAGSRQLHLSFRAAKSPVVSTGRNVRRSCYHSIFGLIRLRLIGPDNRNGTPRRGMWWWKRRGH